MQAAWPGLVASASRATAPVPTRPFAVDIERETLENVLYRRVLHTTPQMQLAVMSLEPGEVIPAETHSDPPTTQFIRVESGRALVRVGRTQYDLENGGVVIIPAGAEHEVVQVGSDPLKLYVLYAPPEHAPSRIDQRQPDE